MMWMIWYMFRLFACNSCLSFCFVYYLFCLFIGWSPICLFMLAISWLVWGKLQEGAGWGDGWCNWAALVGFPAPACPCLPAIARDRSSALPLANTPGLSLFPDASLPFSSSDYQSFVWLLSPGIDADSSLGLASQLCCRLASWPPLPLVTQCCERLLHGLRRRGCWPEHQPERPDWKSSGLKREAQSDFDEFCQRQILRGRRGECEKCKKQGRACAMLWHWNMRSSSSRVAADAFNRSGTKTFFTAVFVRRKTWIRANFWNHTKYKH